MNGYLYMCEAMTPVATSGAGNATGRPATKRPAPHDGCPAWCLRLGWGGACVLLLVVVGLAAQASAQPATLGGEFQVNTYTTSWQRYPAVSVGSSGSFVVVWQSYGSSYSDISAYGIQGQIWASDGTAAFSQFQVNTYTTGSQSHPDLSFGPSGEVVVVWQSEGSSESDSSSLSIQGNVLFLTGEFQVNTFTSSAQSSPAVSVGPGGEFVVVWTSFGSDGSDSSLGSIQGRHYASDGTALTAQFQVNTYTTGWQDSSGVSVGPGGEFVVVWGSYGSSDSDSSSYSIQGRRYASDGAALGSEFQVNTYTTSIQRYPGVSVGPGGEFVVVWESYGSSGSDSSNRSIQGRRYASNGTALGSDFQVNTFTTNSQYGPIVSVGPGGEFVVMWTNRLGSSGSDSSLRSIQGRRYASNGTALGSDFQVNTYTTSYQRFPDVSVDPGGKFVVVWESLGSSGSDSSGWSIQGQRYAALPFFSDGFESGNTSRWSATVP